MLFINPVKFVELQQLNIKSIDEKVIEKPKKKLIAEIKHSYDGHFNYKGQKLSKSDCEKAIEELVVDKNQILSDEYGNPFKEVINFTLLYFARGKLANNKENLNVIQGHFPIMSMY